MRIANTDLSVALATSKKSRVEIARESGVSTVYLWQLETGARTNPGAEKMALIAQALDSSVDDLFGEWLNAIYPAAQEGVTA